MIFNIQRYSTHDGQGIRTLIFYKGCPLRCIWCCNPESQSFGQSLMFDRRLCKNFGECLTAGSKCIVEGNDGIEINRSFAGETERLMNVCPSRALTVSGEEKSTADIIRDVEKDLPFYLGSGGGVTLSGGEPLSQGTELIELLSELRKRAVDVSIETSLHVPWEMVERCIMLTGTFLADLKHTKSEKFRKFAGGDASLVLNNLMRLSALHNDIIIRVPVVPDFNHTRKEMRDIIDFTVSLRTVREIHFLPYHSLGREKYKLLGMEYGFNGINKVNTGELTDYINYAESEGLTAKTGG